MKRKDLPNVTAEERIFADVPFNTQQPLDSSDPVTPLVAVEIAAPDGRARPAVNRLPDQTEGDNRVLDSDCAFEGIGVDR